MKKSIPFAFIVFIALPDSTSAQAIGYECKYDLICSAESGCEKSEFYLEFILDKQTGDAVSVGHNGMTEVFVMNGTDVISFIEPLSSGALQGTTVSYHGKTVHSRHTAFGRDLLPSQYYGDCVVGAR